MDGLRPGSNLSRRSLLGVAVLGAAAPVVGACAGPDAGPTAPSRGAGRASRASAVSTAPDGTQQVVLTVSDDYVFVPESFTVRPGPVRLTLTSEAEQLTHNFEFSAGQGPVAISERIPIVGPGDEDTIEFSVDVIGDYPFECSFHVALGQVGTMRVSAT